MTHIALVSADAALPLDEDMPPLVDAFRRLGVQVARADYDRGPHHPYYEELARAVPEMRRGWLDELDRQRPMLAA